MKTIMKRWVFLVIALCIIFGGTVSCFAYDTSGISHNSRFDGAIKRYGIDVSSHNGNIDWNSVKNSGVEFVFIRMSYRAYRSGTIGTDTAAVKNIEGALNAGLRVGAYIFSQAVNTDEAIAEANYICDQLSGYGVSMPVVMDYEYVSGSSGLTGRLYEANLSKEAATNNVLAFCQTVASHGYTPMLYANKSFLNDKVNAESIAISYPIWLANYTNSTSYSGTYSYWQFSSKGSVSGISGNVDLDVWYDAGDIVGPGSPEGLYADGNGILHYYKNGVIDNSYTGMALYGSQWFYVIGGSVDYHYTGMACNEYGWWYFNDGALDWNYTGMACNEYGWWYYNNGSLDWTYTGMACNENGWWYYNNGSLDWTYTGMACNEYGWWYYNNGNLDWNYTGMACNEYGWWYYNNGNLDWNYTGMACNEYGWWYYSNGNLDWNYTGMACNEDGWWYFNNGAIDYNYTGMACNEDGWWYFNNGTLDMNYTGMACNEYGWWYYNNGMLDWTYTGMACNEYGWWYFNNGVLDWNYTGVAYNEYGTWYFENGRLVY